jgi:hypothetical protein
VTPEWKKLDWRNWGGLELTDEAICGGTCRAGRSVGEGPEEHSLATMERAVKYPEVRWCSGRWRRGWT